MFFFGALPGQLLQTTNTPISHLHSRQWRGARERYNGPVALPGVVVHCPERYTCSDTWAADT